MSAPETNTEKQKKRHKTPLQGMIWVVAFALILLAALVIYVSFSGNEPGDGQPVGAESEGGAATEQVQDAQGADAQED